MTEIFDFILGYDVILDYVKHMRTVDPSFALPDGFFQNEVESK
jgi:hypothetical protein